MKVRNVASFHELSFKLEFLDFSSPDYQAKSFLDASDERNEARSIDGPSKCPENFSCTRLLGQSESVCCPALADLAVAEAQTESEVFDRAQSSE